MRAMLVLLQEALPGRVAEIQLGECGSRTFLDSDVVTIGHSEIRVKDTRVEVAHKGKEVVKLNYVDSSGRERVMMPGNGGTVFLITQSQSLSERYKYALLVMKGKACSVWAFGFKCCGFTWRVENGVFQVWLRSCSQDAI